MGVRGFLSFELPTVIQTKNRLHYSEIRVLHLMVGRLDRLTVGVFLHKRVFPFLHATLVKQ